MDIKIPDLGDGIDGATVLSIVVSVGDSVEKEDTIIELETDKAVAPVPSPASGKIGSILINEGDIVSTGTKIGTLSDGGEADSKAVVSEVTSASVEAVEPISVVASTQTAVVSDPGSYTYVSLSGSPPPSSPSMRRFAALSGLDLCRIQGSGHGGRLTWDDIRNHVAFLQSSAFNGATISSSVSSLPSGPEWMKNQLHCCPTTRILSSAWGKVCFTSTQTITVKTIMTTSSAITE